MIPERVEHLDDMIAEGERQLEALRSLVESVSDEARGWRPSDDKWSMLGHVAHLCLVNGPYMDVLGQVVGRGRAKGLEGDGPYRHPRMATWFTRSMEAPPARRWKTSPKMVPDPALKLSDTVESFSRLQLQLVSTMRDARGLDLGRVRFSSPFLFLLRLSLGTGFELLLAHNRRHVWLMREVMDAPGFPGAESAHSQG